MTFQPSSLGTSGNKENDRGGAGSTRPFSLAIAFAARNCHWQPAGDKISIAMQMELELDGFFCRISTWDSSHKDLNANINQFASSPTSFSQLSSDPKKGSSLCCVFF